ncbi:MAG: 3-dehydroquinate synthase, partial [Clostridia bacterium]|nr:3-dehydroquinate synthase [Clostridia bacterium]
DPDTLSTLPSEVFADGCAEVIKYGVINDRTLFSMLQQDTCPADERIIARCVQDKRDIVELDERDTGVRMLLNLGHTVAHAIEKLSGFEISHGSAVAMGMVMIMRASVAHGLCPASDLEALIALIQKLGLPAECPYSTAEIAVAALSDKKRSADTLTLVLPYGIGACQLCVLPADKLQAFLEAR